MTGEVEYDDHDTSERSAGDLLRHARQAKRLSVEEVARALKVSTRYIHALEEERYADLPAFTFVRGYLMRYGKIVDLDTKALIQRISLLMESPVTLYHQPLMDIKDHRMSKSHRWIMIFLTIVIILGLVGGSWWWLQQKKTINNPVIKQTESYSIEHEKSVLPADTDQPLPKTTPILTLVPAQKIVAVEKKNTSSQ